MIASKQGYTDIVVTLLGANADVNLPARVYVLTTFTESGCMNRNVLSPSGSYTTKLGKLLWPPGGCESAVGIWC